MGAFRDRALLRDTEWPRAAINALGIVCFVSGADLGGVSGDRDGRS